ncbi:MULTISPECIES: hypothetical protein [unclassified Pannonibacter]|uniref:hypothetical protein n=1 Tax=unclassified Pannonibacter TaxID=2627228 RepID=UPI001645EE57|nr:MULTISPECIES: hypothetical protein [unclassified Pannonibacter]
MSDNEIEIEKPEGEKKSWWRQFTIADRICAVVVLVLVFVGVGGLNLIIATPTKTATTNEERREAVRVLKSNFADFVAPVAVNFVRTYKACEGKHSYEVSDDYLAALQALPAVLRGTSIAKDEQLDEKYRFPGADCDTKVLGSAVLVQQAMFAHCVLIKMVALRAPDIVEEFPGPPFVPGEFGQFATVMLKAINTGKMPPEWEVPAPDLATGT